MPAIDRTRRAQTRLDWGPYRLEEPMGGGEASSVWRAFDPAVGRDVAVRLYSRPDLPLEPRLMARVHHASVVTVFGAAVHEGRPGVCMEFVRGRTLADRVRSEGPLPWPAVARIGIDLCRALEAVHDAHLVHGSLCGHNVMERDEGGVVLMDFGAGWSRDVADEEPIAADALPLYMAPEVVRDAGAASPRSDLYSLGVLLYLLLTGRYPRPAASWGQLRRRGHEQDTVTQRELTRELRKMRPDVPAAFARCVSAALVPHGPRHGTAPAFRAALEQSLRAGAFLEPARVQRWLRRSLYAGLIVAAWASGRHLSGPGGETPPYVALSRVTGDGGLATDPVRSADGTLLAYASDRSGEEQLDIWVQRAATGAAIRLTRDPADDSQPSLSADGNYVAFRSERNGGGIYRTGTLGGPAQLMVPGGRHPRFSPDGRHLAYIGGRGFGSLLVTPLAGGAPREVAVDSVPAPAIWSGDGRHLLFTAWTPSGADWWVAPVPVEGAAPPALIRTHAFAELSRHGLAVVAYWPTPCHWDGRRVVFHARHGDTTSVWDIELDAAFRVASAPRRLTLSTEDQLQPSVAEDGSLLFASRMETPYLWTLPIDANRGVPSSITPRLVTQRPHYPGHGVAQLSADGAWMVFASPLPSRPGIWLRNLDSGSERAISTPGAGAVHRFPVIAADGREVVYASQERGEPRILRVAVDGGIPETLCESCGQPADVSADGKYVLLQHGVPERATLGVLDRTTGRHSGILKNAAGELYRATFSPDARWLAFHAAFANGATQEFVAPFRGLRAVDPSEWIAVTRGDSWTDAPRWSPDGNRLYYVSNRDGFRCIWSQALDPATKRPAGDASAVYHAHGRRSSMSNIHVWSIELAVAGERLLFGMGEARGDIWLAHPRTAPRGAVASR